MAYTNAQILSAVVAHWARPAVTQLATSRIASLPFMQSLQQSAVNARLVNASYNIGNDIAPLITPMVDNLLQPYLEKQLSQLPDETIPSLARDILKQASSRGEYSLMDGLITLDRDDIAELQMLVEKNLPKVEAGQSYQVIT